MTADDLHDWVRAELPSNPSRATVLTAAAAAALREANGDKCKGCRTLVSRGQASLDLDASNYRVVVVDPDEPGPVFVAGNVRAQLPNGTVILDSRATSNPLTAVPDEGTVRQATKVFSGTRTCPGVEGQGFELSSVTTGVGLLDVPGPEQPLPTETGFESSKPRSARARARPERGSATRVLHDAMMQVGRAATQRALAALPGASAAVAAYRRHAFKTQPLLAAVGDAGPLGMAMQAVARGGDEPWRDVLHYDGDDACLSFGVHLGEPDVGGWAALFFPVGKARLYAFRPRGGWTSAMLTTLYHLPLSGGPPGRKAVSLIYYSARRLLQPAGGFVAQPHLMCRVSYGGALPSPPGAAGSSSEAPRRLGKDKADRAERVAIERSDMRPSVRHSGPVRENRFTAAAGLLMRRSVNGATLRSYAGTGRYVSLHTPLYVPLASGCPFCGGGDTACCAAPATAERLYYSATEDILVVDVRLAGGAVLTRSAHDVGAWLFAAENVRNDATRRSWPSVEREAIHASALLNVGASVEAAGYGDEGLSGAWFAGEVVSVHVDANNKDAPTAPFEDAYEVKFDAFCAAANEYKARWECAAVPGVGGPGGSGTQKVHALPALRPAPPPRLAQVGEPRENGDLVDMLHKNAWWAGQVVAVSDADGTVTVRCSPYPYGCGDTRPGVALDHVRTRMTYDAREAKWSAVV